MSLDHTALLPQITEIKHHLATFPNAEVAKVTNKRMILRCPDGAVALALRKDLEAAGYACGLKPGRLSSAYYVQALFHYPY